MNIWIDNTELKKKNNFSLFLTPILYDIFKIFKQAVVPTVNVDVHKYHGFCTVQNM